MQLQLAAEKEERERAQRKVGGAARGWAGWREGGTTWGRGGGGGLSLFVA